MTITAKQIESFRSAVLNCDADACTSFLRDAESAQFANYKLLIAFHDALLLLEAYPCSQDLYERAVHLLRTFENLTKRFIRKNKSAVEKLVNSGLKGTEAQGSFTFPLIQLLSGHSPESVYIHSFGDEGKSLNDVLRHFLPKTEFETLDAGYDTDELFNELFGKQNQLQALVNSMCRSSVPESVRDALFDDLKMFAGIKFDGKIPERSVARGPERGIFIHSDIQRKPIPLDVVNRGLPSPVILTKEQQSALQIQCASMLASLNRETDPVSLCADDGITLFELERGVSVALFSMKPGRRLPLDSYIGYVLFKNRVPHAYGGAWLFGNRALFGINIFEPFRGGESSLTILQLLRVYRQCYGISAFSVEPYQYGLDNPEGIESGAYWFYYKMGFRSDEAKLSDLAEKEVAKMQKKGTYRTSHATLRKFTASNITWKIDDVKLLPNPADVSRATTEFIRKHYQGNREKCIQDLNQFHGLKRGEVPDEYLVTFLWQKNSVVSRLYVNLVKQLAIAKHANERQYNQLLHSLYANIQ
jgi:hypothetical protein